MNELRLTLGDPCEALMCPNDAAEVVVDHQSKPWRLCVDHAAIARENVHHLRLLTGARDRIASALAEARGQQRLFDR